MNAKRHMLMLWLLWEAKRAGRALFVVALVGLAGALLFGHMRAAAQTQPLPDKPISISPQLWTGRVVDVQAQPFRACMAGYHRAADPYGDWLRAVAWVDFARLTQAQIAAIGAAFAAADLAALTALRTVIVDGDKDQAAAPCLAKLGPMPPPVWRVAALASGKRPAYTLGADGKRGAQSGTADVLIEGQPMPCNCKVRSVETTSSTYCAWLTARQTFDAAEPVRVTLCRGTP